MIWTRCCPRCKGDLQDNRDIYGFYFVCIQCGYYLTDSEEARMRHSAGYRSPAGPNDSAKNIKTLIAGAPWGGTG